VYGLAGGGRVRRGLVSWGWKWLGEVWIFESFFGGVKFGRV